NSTAPVTAPVTLPPTRVTAGAPAIRTGRRPQRKEKSGLLFLINVVAGGVLAAPLALLTLWWVFGVDPPELGPVGPKVARYAPWIVPKRLRGDDETEISISRPRGYVGKERQPQPATAATQRPLPETELQTLPNLDERAK